MIPVLLDPEELHILVTYCYAMREKDGDRRTEIEKRLMDKLVALRNEHAPFLP